MMKQLILTGALLLGSAMAGEAMAACDAKNQVKNGDLPKLLKGNTICVANSGGWEKQEEHHSGGELWDYKMGDHHKIDPRKKLGSWSATTNGADSAVTYKYENITTGPYKVYSTGGNSYDFCRGGTVEASGTLIKGTGVGCSRGGIELHKDEKEGREDKPTLRERR
jgi:hypothetical protein